MAGISPNHICLAILKLYLGYMFDDIWLFIFGIQLTTSGPLAAALAGAGLSGQHIFPGKHARRGTHGVRGFPGSGAFHAGNG